MRANWAVNGLWARIERIPVSRPAPWQTANPLNPLSESADSFALIPPILSIL